MRKKTGFFVKLALVTIIFFLVISIVDKNITLNELKKEQEELEQEYQLYTLRVDRLESQLEEEVTEETIKRIAKEKLNLREPDDLIFANDLPN